MNLARQEGVILIYDQDETITGEPVYMMRKNGSIKYYKLVEMNWADHVEWLGAENVQK